VSTRGYLLDTNVISELRRPKRSAAVVEWVGALATDGLFISVVTVGEIAKGIAKRRRMSGAVAADALQSWLEGLLAMYADRIIPVDVPIATRWGRLCDVHPQLATDMLLAATALDRELTIATRNTDHFRLAGVPVVDPFVA
jgi:predicted nucleic acid-binding protein